MMFRALTSQQNTDNRLLVVDIGYSARRESCGLYWTGCKAGVDSTFGHAVASAAEFVLQLASPILVIEAPLSTCHDGSTGNPSIRGGFESGRGWYYGAGATTCLAAMRFLDQLAITLQSSGFTKDLLVAEAFLSNKATKTNHSADAKKIHDNFWQAVPARICDNLDPASQHVAGIPPVRVF